MSVRNVTCPLPEFANVGSHVPRVSVFKVVHRKHLTENSRRQGLGTQQSSAELMKDHVEMFPKPDELVLDALAGTFSAVKACQLLDEHRIFVGF